jgi:hypothetical protein
MPKQTSFQMVSVLPYLPVIQPFASRPDDVVNGSGVMTVPVSSRTVRIDTLLSRERTLAVPLGYLSNTY